jgi:hypothetical protein
MRARTRSRLIRRFFLLASLVAIGSGCWSQKTVNHTSETENAQVNHQELQALADKVDSSLAQGDLVSAQREALTYRAQRGADPNLLTEWRRKIWMISESWGSRDNSALAKREIKSAVAARKKLYAHERKMSHEAFVKWLGKQGATPTEPLFSKIDVQDGSVQLWVSNQQMPTLDFNMKTLAEINDALVARCGCAGRTNVGTYDTGFPVYLVRLDPDTRQSQVIAMPR